MEKSFIKVRVSAGAKTEKVEEVSSNEFRVRTTTAPEKGKANEKVRELLAKHLGIPRMSLYLKSGHTSRDKIFIIEDLI